MKRRIQVKDTATCRLAACLTIIMTMLFCIPPASVAASSFEQFWADAQKEKRAEKSEASRHRMAWWRDARFGMFIHSDLQVSNWADNAVTIPDLPVTVLSANVLTGGEVTMTRADGKLSFKVDPKFRDPAITVIKLTLEKPADGIPPREVPGN